MPGSIYRFRADDGLSESIDSFATVRHSGNKSAALRELVTTGLALDASISNFEDRIDGVLERHLERMARISAKGAKASLANLALASTYFPPIAAMVEESSRIAVERAAGGRSVHAEETIDAALVPIAKLRGASAAKVFDYAWLVGGRMQASKGGIDFYGCSKGSGADRSGQLLDRNGSDLWGQMR